MDVLLELEMVDGLFVRRFYDWPSQPVNLPQFDSLPGVYDRAVDLHVYRLLRKLGRYVVSPVHGTGVGFTAAKGRGG